MKRAGLALAAVTLASCGTFVPVGAGASGEYMPCGTEDDVNCVWDARHMGNGEGHSYFTGPGGRVWRLPHHIAHALVYGGAR